MNLWVNRLRQLATLAVALFFFSCEDETSFLGFKNPNDKFDNYSVEIPLESSVIWLDSVRTSNGYLPTDVSRFLVGRYTDPVFGTVSSTAAGQIFWTTPAKLAEGATFESAELWLAFDLYFYGPETPAPQTFTVHQIQSDMRDIRRSKYVNKTELSLSEPIGSITREINPEVLRELYNPTSNDQAQPDTMKISLGPEFHEPLWGALQAWSYNSDSSYYKVEEFLSSFKGLAIKPGAENTMMVGFSPSAFTQIVLYYTVGTTRTRVVYRFDPGLLSYNNIVPDYTGTPLEGITYHTDMMPAGDLRFMQAGTGIGTKLDMSNFLNFADTVGPNIIINDVELVVDGIDAPEGFAPPMQFMVRGLTQDNTIRKLPEFTEAGSADNDVFNAFKGLVTVDYQDPQRRFAGVFNSDIGAIVANDGGSPATFGYSSTDTRYTGRATLFFQQLYRNRANPEWTNLLMFPVVSAGSGASSLKAVNRVVFPADQIKLKIKYTKPTLAD